MGKECKRDVLQEWNWGGGANQGCSYGGRRRAGPPTTHDLRPALIFFFFFFLVPGTMFHNRGSIIAQYTYVIYIENDLVRLWIPAGAPPVVGAALRWLHSLRLPLLFTIINHHSDWAGYNPGANGRPILIWTPNFPELFLFRTFVLQVDNWYTLLLTILEYEVVPGWMQIMICECMYFLCNMICWTACQGMLLNKMKLCTVLAWNCMQWP